MAAGDLAKAQRRVLRLLSLADARLECAAVKGTLLLDGAGHGTVAAPRRLVDALQAQGLAVLRDGVLSITPAGTRLLGRTGPGAAGPGAAGPGADGAREIGLVEVDGPDGPATLPVNLAESPLGLLARRRGKDGRPFLDETEWRAGERFRADYTRGQIMPRLGANWIAAVAGGRRGGPGGTAELTDAALAARIRVDKAIVAVGPELAGVLVDICCFLKGLELVESERGWPVRSAKVMLKAALGALARHYDPEQGRARRPPYRLHWGAEGYRPSIAAGTPP